MMSIKKIFFFIVIVSLLYYYFSGPRVAKWEIANFKPNPQNIVAFGDSLTQGVGATKETSYPSQLSEKIGIPIINKGVSGATTVDALQVLEDSVLSLNPDLVLITITGNDMMRKVQFSLAMTNLEKIFSTAVSSGSMVAFLSIKPPLVNSKWYKKPRELAKKHGVIWVDRILKGLWTNNSLMSDTIHPNGKGYELVADKVYDTLKRQKVFQ